MKTSLILGSLLFFSLQAQAQIVFKGVEAYGTGCPAGTVGTSITPDGTALSVIFDEFRVEVPEHTPPTHTGPFPRAPRTRPTRAMRDCQLRFTVDLPFGHKVEALEVTVQARGATILDPEIFATFTSILVGYTGLAQQRRNPTPIIQKSWSPNPAGVQDEWVSMPTAQIGINSGCASARGRSVTFDLKNHLSAEIITGNLSRQGIVSVDSADASGMLRFRVLTSRCLGAR